MKTLLLVCLGIFVLALGAGAYMFFVSDKPVSQTESAKQCFIKACKKPEETKGFHININMHVKAGNDGFKMEMNGKQQNPDMIYLEGVFDNQLVALYMKGRKVVSGLPERNLWRLEPETAEENKLESMPFKQMIKNAQYIVDAEFMKDTELINGMRCQGVIARFDRKEILKLANLENFPYKDMLKFKDVSYKMWYNILDSRPVRIIFSLMATAEDSMMPKVDIDASFELLLFGYDRDVEIYFPEEVTNLMEERKPQPPEQPAYQEQPRYQEQPQYQEEPQQQEEPYSGE
jgi:hypothetical protein